MSSTQFRVFGAALGEPDSFIDVQATGIDEEVNITFVDRDDNTRTFELSSSEIKQLLRENLMVENSEVVNHPLWDMADNITALHAEATQEYVAEKLVEAQKAMVMAAYLETR